MSWVFCANFLVDVKFFAKKEAIDRLLFSKQLQVNYVENLQKKTEDINFGMQIRQKDIYG